MTTPASSVEGIDLSLNEFWAQSPAARHTDFAKLRAIGNACRTSRSRRIPSATLGAAITPSSRMPTSPRPAVSRSCSQWPARATSLADLPPEFNEYFGSMISMDDSRCTPGCAG